MTPFVKPVEGRPFVIRVIKEAEDELNFANAWHTVRANQYLAIEAAAESPALLAHLYRHSVHENLTVRLRWQRHTLAIWDNRCTQHNALNDYQGQPREMFRTSVTGAAPTPFAST